MEFMGGEVEFHLGAKSVGKTSFGITIKYDKPVPKFVHVEEKI